MLSLAGIISVMMTTGFRPASIASIPASFARSDAGDDLCSVVAHEFCMKRTLVACYSLNDSPGPLADEQGHFLSHQLGRRDKPGCFVHHFKGCDTCRVEESLSFLIVSALHPDNQRLLQSNHLLHVENSLSNLIASRDSS